jgi:hypothetical protein
LKRDLRKFAKQTNFRLVFGFLVLLFLIGDGLIYLIYGTGAAVTGLICIAGALTPVLLITGILALLDLIVKKVNDE